MVRDWGITICRHALKVMLITKPSTIVLLQWEKVVVDASFGRRRTDEGFHNSRQFPNLSSWCKRKQASRDTYGATKRQLKHYFGTACVAADAGAINFAAKLQRINISLTLFVSLDGLSLRLTGCPMRRRRIMTPTALRFWKRWDIR